VKGRNGAICSLTFTLQERKCEMTRLIDLTCPFDPKYSVPQYPTIYQDIDISYKYTVHRDGRYCTQFTLTTHTGTHVDAPMHIYEDGKPLSNYPLERFYGEAVVLDIPKGELEEITAADLEKAKPEVQPDDIVLIHTGWGRFYEGEERKHELYLARRQPGLVVDAAQWLVDKKVKAVGIDAFTIRHPYPEQSDYPLTEEDILAGKSRPIEPVHDILLGNDVLIVEQLTNLHLIAGKRVTVCFLPLPFVGLDGSPVRAMAWVD